MLSEASGLKLGFPSSRVDCQDGSGAYHLPSVAQLSLQPRESGVFSDGCAQGPRKSLNLEEASQINPCRRKTRHLLLF